MLFNVHVCFINQALCLGDSKLVGMLGSTERELLLVFRCNL